MNTPTRVRTRPSKQAGGEMNSAQPTEVESSIAGTFRPYSGDAQRTRLLEALRRGPVDTVHAYRVLDILHPPRRILELRKAGNKITTAWVWRYTKQGKRHRVGVYLLEREAE